MKRLVKSPDFWKVQDEPSFKIPAKEFYTTVQVHYVPVLLYFYTVNGYYSDPWSGVISKNTVIIHVSLK
jgi:hypothetical protein